MIRIVTSIDFSTDDPREAYRAWQRFWKETLGDVESHPDIEGVESTDDWYDADGESIDEDDVQAVRMNVFREIGAV